MRGPSASDRERVPGRGSPTRGDLTRVLAIAGPTGTGKSELAVAVARRLDGEIVGCDAFQVYRGLDAATAKPDEALLRAVPHHLVSHVDPHERYSVARFVSDADAAIASIVARGAIPIVVGGSGMYLWGLLYGVEASAPRDERLTGRLRRMGERFGPARLHRLLATLDPASARRIAPQDRQRVVRALEMALGDGPSWSERLARDGTWTDRAPRYRATTVVLDLARDVLARRLEARADRFIARGLVHEVRRHLAAGVPAGANALKAIGYREVVDALTSGADPARPAVRERIRSATRRYAKRQRTWLRRDRSAAWLDAGLPRGELVDRVIALWTGGETS